MQAKLSVVIPAYNVEAYISDCITSVLKQTNAHIFLKIIVVVDGATDRTLEIAQEIAQKNPRMITVLSQKNMGPSSARNLAIQLVDTEFVTYLDADDQWTPNYLETVVDHLNQGVDLIEYDAIKVNQQGAMIDLLKIAVSDLNSVCKIDKKDFVKIFRCYSWARIYRTNMVLEHLFPENRRFEDTATTPWFYWKSENIVSIGCPLILYRQHPSSILATPRLNDIIEISEAARESTELYHQTQEEFWRIVAYRIFHFACSRIYLLPIKYWPLAAKISRQSIGDLTPPKGIMRKLQRNAPLIYVVALTIKRKITST